MSILWLLLAGGCSLKEGKETVPALGSDIQALAKTLVYQCAGYEFIARMGAGEMAVWLEDRYLVLSRVRSASGAKYQEGDVIFWSKGEEVILIIDNQQFSSCMLAPHRAPWEDARRRGVDFRAVGNEPGWYLEIQHDRHLLFVADYGMKRVLIASPVLSVKDPLSVYRAENTKDKIRVERVDEICTDTMKGDTFTSQVTVYWREKTYRGCGESLIQYWK